MRFLETIADKILHEYDDPGEVLVIFPNRRAGLFLTSLLQSKLKSPLWAPDIISFQDMVRRESILQLGDPMQLIYELYLIYAKHLPQAKEDGFERFYYWGKMLLRDFDEIDKYRVDGHLLYKNLVHQKELDLLFDFLTEEQKEALKSFWQGFEESKSENKQRFLNIWEKLGDIFSDYREQLTDKQMAYEGLLYRELAENLETHEWKYNRKHVIFAGFNALTQTEEDIISWFVINKNATILWDLDEYYINDRRQEAGPFLRDYRSKSIFSRSFPDPLPNGLVTSEKKIEIIGVPQHIGQARLTGQMISELLTADPTIDLKSIAVVLADESLLIPVLSSLPPEAGSVNITMGFPLSFAPVNSLIEYLTELQIFYKRNRGFYYQPLAGLFRHPLVLLLEKDHSDLLDKMEHYNQVYISEDSLPGSPLFSLIFKESKNNFLEYCIAILEEIETSDRLDQMNRTFVHYYRSQFVRYHTILGEYDEHRINVETFKRLFRQLAGTEKVPFTGEPLEGIQIMGVLETRNLDFAHVFLLTCNEGHIPSSASQHSFLPYNIRKAYNLPHNDQQDAIYAYLFYRLIQGVKSIRLFWNTEGNDFGEEEMSRFLKQLIYEFPQKVKQNVLANDTGVPPVRPITIERDDRIREKLSFYYTEGTGKGISPSALNIYMECKLKFYYRYIAGLFEKEEMNEDLDSRTLGNVLHKLIEIVFLDHINKKGHIVEKSDIKDMLEALDPSIDKAFRIFYHLEEDQPFIIEGKNLIAREIISEFAQRILLTDSKYAPFEIIGVEEKIEIWENLANGHKVKLKGAIDRIDLSGGSMRIIDYKTGEADIGLPDIESLFKRDKRNKVAFQAFLYTHMYSHKHTVQNKLVPSIYNKNVLFQETDFRFEIGSKNDYTIIEDFAPYLSEFTERLDTLLEEIFFSDEPFDQTENLKMCRYCPYNTICQTV